MEGTLGTCSDLCRELAAALDDNPTRCSLSGRMQARCDLLLWEPPRTWGWGQ